MPLYDYECEQCGNVQEVYHSMFDKNSKPCEKCGSLVMRKLFSPPYAQVVGSTVGSLGEKNFKALSEEEKDKLRKPKYVEKNPLIKAAATKTDEEVMRMSPERQRKYILDGV